MRFMLLSLLLLSLFLCFSTLPVRGQYAAVFLNARSKEIAASLKQTTSPYKALNDVDQSYNKLQAHHLTIEFRPNPLNKFERFYQDVHSIRVLAYAHDSHGQALLVELEDNECKQSGGIEIANEWPHITISEQAQRPYTAVYSNDLIGRLFHANILKVKETDSYGKPTKVALGNNTISRTEWWGEAPAFTSNATATTQPQFYEATPVYVKLFPQNYGRWAFRLRGTVCFNTAWNDTTVACSAPKVTN